MYGRKEKEEERPVNKSYLGGKPIIVEDIIVSCNDEITERMWTFARNWKLSAGEDLKSFPGRSGWDLGSSSIPPSLYSPTASTYWEEPPSPSCCWYKPTSWNISCSTGSLPRREASKAECVRVRYWLWVFQPQEDEDDWRLRVRFNFTDASSLC